MARRIFGVPCAAYVDDFDTTDPVCAGKSGKEALHTLCRLMGVPLSRGAKDVDPAPSNPFLGVVADLSRVVDGIAVLKSKVTRVARMIVDMEDMLQAGRASKTTMEQIVGKLEYTSTSGAAGRFGRAALSMLRSWAQHGFASVPFPEAVELALRFFILVLPLIPPRVFKLRKVPRSPILVYTDARYSPNSPEPAQIGIAIFDPEDVEAGAPQWRHSDLVISPALMAKFREREQYVGQLEVLGGVAAYTSRPEQFRGRDVVHFIDNTGALFGLSKGYSGDDDSARLIHSFHSVLGAIDCNVWLEYVASGANIADLPSRGEFGMLHELGSIRFPTILPVIGGDWREVYTRIFADLAPRPSKGSKRMRAEIGAETAAIKARRGV
jgi:hypothetical protein